MEGINYFASETDLPTASQGSKSSFVNVSSTSTSLIILPDLPSKVPDFRSEAIPRTYSELLKQAKEFFANYEVFRISYQDNDNDFVIITNDYDLTEAYSSGQKSQNYLQIYLKVSIKKTSKICEKSEINNFGITETAPDIIKESLWAPCYKCKKSPETCAKCSGSGRVDVYSDPKLNSVRAIIRKEMENYLPKLLSAVSEEPSSIVHENIICNRCGTYPIIGHRYKCSVCMDFDFCQNCEKSVTHEHPFIKIRSPQYVLKTIFCALDDSKKKSLKPKNRQCEPSTRLLCRFVKDVVGNEGDLKEPGEVFLKSWRLRNDGATQWPRGCRLVFTNGDFGGDDAVLPCLKPGEEKDISVTCRSPDRDGRYNSYWRPVDPCNGRFGQRLSITILVQRQVGKKGDLTALREIFNNPEIVKIAYEKAGGSMQKAVEILLSGNFV